MTYNESPWNNMSNSSQRRVDSKTNHDIFWIIDSYGNYGFRIHSKKIAIDSGNDIKLKGINIIKGNSISDSVDLFLILNNQEDWGIFLALCEDLISVTKRYQSDEKMINVIENRLRRWQQLLKQERNRLFSPEQQMGLFSELLCLRNVVAKKSSIKQAIVSWVGPDYDKQDFLLDNAIIEVKSYRTSKGEIVNISSVHQLHSENKPLFLITYALTNSENGLTVEDVSKSIRDIILPLDSDEIMDMFENKLLEYGYIPEIIKEPLQKFIVDKQKVYKVTNDFPRISKDVIKHQITSVKYSIDLSLCGEYEVDINIFIEGGI